MEEIYVYQKIKKMEMVLMDDDESYEDQDFMVDDPMEETSVVIEITINRFTQFSPTATETMDGSTTELYLLEDFLDEDYSFRLDELNSLVRRRKVSARNLEEIKQMILSYSSKINEIAYELRRGELVIEMELDVLTWYSHEDLGVEFAVVEEMVDDDECEDVGMPALISSVDALETRRFEKEEDLERMLKSRGDRLCTVCMDEFSIGSGGGISVTVMPCLHMFHSECILQWLGKRHTCPTCRYKMPTVDG